MYIYILTDYLRFLYLGNSNTVDRGDDDYSSAIFSPVSIKFGYHTETPVYVSGCGKYVIVLPVIYLSCMCW